MPIYNIIKHPICISLYTPVQNDNKFLLVQTDEDNVLLSQDSWGEVLLPQDGNVQVLFSQDDKGSVLLPQDGKDNALL